MESIRQPQNRSEYWTEIAALAADLEGIHVSEDTFEALAVDSNIYPRLPPVTDVFARLESRLEGKCTQDLRNAIRTKCVQLQDHVLNGYRSTVNRMPSMRRTLGVADNESQRQYSEALEKWYFRAVQEILDACVARKTKYPIVRDHAGDRCFASSSS